MNISDRRLRGLCVKHDWFNRGTRDQYDKLFYANAHGAPLEELATIIWLCSDSDKWCRRDIISALMSEDLRFYGESRDYKHSMWCVEYKDSINNVIDSRFFADYEPAKEFYDAIGEDAYRKIYSTFDTRGYLKRNWKDGEVI